MSKTALASAAAGVQTPDLTVADAGGSTVERLLRVGSAALGCSLSFTEAGSVADAFGARSVFLPNRSFESTIPVVGVDGQVFGTLRATDLAGRGDFSEDEARTLVDLAAVISSAIASKRSIRQHDHVTGLPNRKGFERDFHNAVAIIRGDASLLLVTLADAKHYNEILRALGHACAEQFVRQGAKTIGNASGHHPMHHVSVLSFAFVVDQASIEALACEIVSAFERPVVCDGLPITTRIGVGMTRIDPGKLRPAETLRAALAAAQDSRRLARGYAYYDRRSDEAHLRAFSLLTDLKAALNDEGQLSLAYQPRIDLACGATAGAEVLIRWAHPTLGPIPPAEFIPLAETTSIIEDVTDWVLDRACRQSAVWRRQGLDAGLSINVSPSSLHDDGFLDRVADRLRQHDVDPSHLEFEFTEGTLASSEAGVRAKIDAIRGTGTTIAIDDFGAGYSNFDYLTRLPADVLKLDRSFVQSLESDDRRQKLVRAMIDLAHDLNFRVVAEGIENRAVYDMLTDWRCDEGQGFFMSRPLTAAAFAAFARDAKAS